MQELDYPFDSELLRRKKRKLKKILLEDSSRSFISKRIAILGGSTTDEVKDILELFLLNSGICPQFYQSEYNKYYEDGMFGNDVLSAFHPDIIYIHTSYKNIDYLPLPSDTPDEANKKLDLVLSKFKGLWAKLFSTYNCVIIQNNFELPYYRILGNQDTALCQGHVNFVNRLNLEFANYAQDNSNFFIHDICYEQAVYGLDEWSNPLYWDMYKYALAVPAIPDSAYNIFKIIKSIYGKNKKALSLDLDNTLWGGIVGDDGPENIEIGEETPLAQSYSNFQRYIKKLKEVGVILTVNSKNEQSAAESGLNRPDSILKRTDFVSFKANWNPKSQNLIESAKEINILPESFVFADDNPAEREIVRQNIPGVAIPDFTSVENYIKAIDRAGYFEITKLSKDDLDRSSMYEANAKRLESMNSFLDYGEYLKSLEMKAEIKPFAAEYMARIAQLTNKSNQFNLTTKRMTQIEVESVASDNNYITLYGKLEDKFGDNGVVSVVIGKIHNSELHIELWLMSCRVLRRDMEYAMMDQLVKICLSRGINTIYGYYFPTPKNSMVKDFYSLQGFDLVSDDSSSNTTWKKSINTNTPLKNKYIMVNKKADL